MSVTPAPIHMRVPAASPSSQQRSQHNPERLLIHAPRHAQLPRGSSTWIAPDNKRGAGTSVVAGAVIRTASNPSAFPFLPGNNPR